jgi:hypothetical protein
MSRAVQIPYQLSNLEIHELNDILRQIQLDLNAIQINEHKHAGTEVGDPDDDALQIVESSITPPVLKASKNNYNPDGLKDATIVRVSASSAINITGFKKQPAGTIKRFFNYGTFNITLKDASALSLRANRFELESDVVITPNTTVSVQYDGESDRWRSVGAAPGVGAVTDHGALTGLLDDDHTQYLLASAATSRALFATNWADLTDTGSTSLHTHPSGATNITGGGAAGQVAFFDATNSITGDADFIFSSDKLIVGGTSPGGVLHSKSATVNEILLLLENTNTTAGASVPFFMSSMSGGSQTNISFENAGAGDYVIRTGATTLTGFGSIRQRLDPSGNVGLGGTNTGGLTGSKLTISGSRMGFNVGGGAHVEAVQLIAPDVNEGLLVYNTKATTDASVPLFLAGTNGTSNISNVSIEAVTVSSTTPANFVLRTGATALHDFGTARLTISGATGNVLVNGFTATAIGLTVKAAAAHTANLLEIQDDDGTVLHSFI